MWRLPIFHDNFPDVPLLSATNGLNAKVPILPKSPLFLRAFNKTCNHPPCWVSLHVIKQTIPRALQILAGMCWRSLIGRESMTCSLSNHVIQHQNDVIPYGESSITTGTERGLKLHNLMSPGPQSPHNPLLSLNRPRFNNYLK